MNLSDFTYLLQRPDALNEQQIDSLDMILKEFPYFQAARAIHLKGLQHQDSYRYNEALKTTAAYTQDRSILFDLITSQQFSQHQISEKIQGQLRNIKEIEVTAEEISLSKEQRLETSLKTKISEASSVLDPSLFAPKEEKQLAHDPVDSIEEKPTEPESVIDEAEQRLAIGKPFDFDKNEAHSFNQWLQLTSMKPIVRQEKSPSAPKVETEQEKKFNLIDRFIQKSPKIIPPKKPVKSDVDLSKEALYDKSELMTETLARVYLEQKKYKKAIKAYKILSLKYPEKSGFFADQIRAVEKLQQSK